MLRLDKGSLAAIGCAAKEKMRYALNALYVTNGETVATDGRKLIVVKHPGEQDEDAVDLIPKLIERDGVEAAQKSLSGKVRDAQDLKEIHVNVRASNENCNLHASLPVTAGQRAEAELKAEEGQFPNWQEVIPHEGDYTASVYLDARHFAAMLKVIVETGKARGLDADGANRVLFKIKAGPDGTSSLSPVRLESKTGDVYGVLMPVDRG